jgi:hypothetical protein
MVGLGEVYTASDIAVKDLSFLKKGIFRVAVVEVRALM